MSGFQPVQSSSSDAANLNQINRMIAQLQKEAQTKVFYGPGARPAIINGKQLNGKYGDVYYQNGEARIVIGEDPDGNMNIHISKAGNDVLDLFT